MKTTITTEDGRQVEIELTPEQEAMLIKPSTNRWRAEKGRTYYSYSSYGEIFGQYDFFTADDNGRYNLGNYYQTKKQAEFARDKQFAIVRINDRIAEYNNGVEGDAFIAFNEDGKLYIRYQDGITYAFVLDTIVDVESGFKIIEEFRYDLLKFIFN